MLRRLLVILVLFCSFGTSTAQYLKHPDLIFLASGSELIPEKLKGPVKSCIWDEILKYEVRWDSLGQITSSNYVITSTKEVPTNPAHFDFEYDEKGKLKYVHNLTPKNKYMFESNRLDSVKYYLFYEDEHLKQIEVHKSPKAYTFKRTINYGHRIKTEKSSGPDERYEHTLTTYYNNEGQPVKQEGFGSVYIYHWDSNGNMVTQKRITDEWKDSWKYKWDKHGNLQEATRKGYPGNKKKTTWRFRYEEPNGKYKYTYIYDNYGNWIERNIFWNKKSFSKTVRVIEYYESVTL